MVCGDAFIVNGQSNSFNISSEATFQNEYCRTFGKKTTNSNNDAYSNYDTLWTYSQGNSLTGASVGALGLYIQKYIMEENQIPTCLINGGTGESTIENHLPDSTDRIDLNSVYGKLLYRITKGKINNIKGIIWYHGESDANEDNIIGYPQRFQELYDSWKIDYNPEKVYVFQLPPGNGGDNQSEFREMQRTIPDSLQVDNLSLMSTVGLPGYNGVNYNIEGYQSMAEWVCNLINVDFYKSTDSLEIYPPNIKKIEYHKEQQEMVLLFENTESLVWPDDISEHKMIDYFYCDSDSGVIESGRTNKDSVILKLNGSHFFDEITYLPNAKYHDSYANYKGPFIKNSRGIGVLSFYKYLVENPENIVKVVSPNGGEVWLPNSEQVIEWTSSNINMLKLEYSLNNGVDWNLIANDINANQNSYTWITPEVWSDEYKIRISDMTDSTTADESNKVFGIYEKGIRVISPNGGEIFYADSTYAISWTSNIVKTVQIQYSIDNEVTWNTIKLRISASEKEYDWKVPNIASSNCKIKIKDKYDSEIYDICDAPFTIIASTEIENSELGKPDKFALNQNYPNPFNPTTIIPFELKNTAKVQISVYDITGNLVELLVDRKMDSGYYKIDFQASQYPTGIYFYKMNVDGMIFSKKMLYIK